MRICNMQSRGEERERSAKRAINGNAQVQCGPKILLTNLPFFDDWVVTMTQESEFQCR